jgi:hypothetical protein
MCDNVGVGTEALRRNTSGCANIAIGTTSLVFNTTGISNVAIGKDAARANTVGSGNVFIGTEAGRSSDSVGRSVAVGEFSQRNSVTGQCNTSVGWSSLNSASGSFNTALGTCAGSFITTGGNNVAIGFCAQVAFGDQFNQLAIGYNAGCNWLTGDGDKHIRPGAGIRDCTGGLGSAGQVLTTTGGAIQWASAGGAKQYLYALVGTTGANINSGLTIPLLGISAGGGLGVSFSNVILTVGKTYLLTASLLVTARNNLPIARWVAGGAQIGPEVYLETTYINSSSSWVYSPTSGSNNAVQLQLGQGNVTFRREASSLTIVEI